MNRWTAVQLVPMFFIGRRPTKLFIFVLVTALAHRSRTLAELLEATLA